jgi:hypothetical protein
MGERKTYHSLFNGYVKACNTHDEQLVFYTGFLEKVPLTVVLADST